MVVIVEIAMVALVVVVALLHVNDNRIVGTVLVVIVRAEWSWQRRVVEEYT